MSVVFDDNTLFGQVHFEANPGLFSGSQGNNDFATAPYASLMHTSFLNTTVKVSFAYNTYFKLQGFNPNTGLYEIWHCMNTPVFTPPSGDNLLNVSVISTWTDR